MLVVVLALIGLALGVPSDAELVGALAGIALGLILQSRTQTRQLEQQVAALSQKLSHLEQTLSRVALPTGVITAAPTPVSKPTTLSPEANTDLPEAREHVPVFHSEPAPPSLPIQSDSPAKPPLAANAAPDFPRTAELLKQWLLGGNLVARGGILVLLVGVVLLLKWAADNQLFPPEARVACVVLGGSTLLVLGYRMRGQRPGLGVTLQGGGIATLYLATFFAYHTYGLIPPSVAFALFAVTALASCGISVAQNAESLVVIGLLGAYSAPILASSGSGSHVGLFAYTLLLNVLVLLLCYLKGWVNAARVGFIFTFGLFTSWRVLRYAPADIASSEPFLFAFFLVYLAVPALLLRKRNDEKLNGLGILFGTPLASLALHASLFSQDPASMAVCSVAMGLSYAGLTFFLLKRDAVKYKPLAQAFVAIAACLGTLAVPFALQGKRATSATWVLEGAGIVWFSLRQNRRAVAIAGALLQGVGFLVFLSSLDDVAAFTGALVTTAASEFTNDGLELAPTTPNLLTEAFQLWSGAWLQALGLYLTALFTYRKQELWSSGWKAFQPALLLASWAFFWGPLSALENLVPKEYVFALSYTWLAVASVLSERLAQKLGYSLGRLPALVIFAIFPYALGVALDHNAHPLRFPDALAWVFLWAALVHTLWHLVLPQLTRFGWLLGVTVWWSAAFVSVELSGLTRRMPDGSAWNPAAWLVGPTLVLFGVTQLAPYLLKKELPAMFPLASSDRPLLLRQLVRLGSTPLALLLVLAVFGQSFSVSGECAPLPYFPLLNPTDLSHVLALAAVWLWSGQTPDAISTDGFAVAGASKLQQRARYASFGVAFIGFTALLGRAVHHYTGAAFDPDELFHSEAFQVAVSVAWTLLALSLMWFSSRIKLRSGWSVGAVLLGVTICKLFLVDLERLGSGAKIITFLGVGALMLLIAFVAPLPPPKPDPIRARPLKSSDEPQA